MSFDIVVMSHMLFVMTDIVILLFPDNFKLSLCYDFIHVTHKLFSQYAC